MIILFLSVFALYTQSVTSQNTCKHSTVVQLTEVGDNYQLFNATYAPDQDCTYTILFPNDKAAMITVHVINLDGSAKAHIWNDFGNDFGANAEGKLWSNNYWPPPLAYFRMQTGNDTRVAMSLEIELRQLNVGVAANTTTVYLHTFDKAKIFENMVSDTAYNFIADTKVALSAAFFISQYMPYYMNYFIYEGPQNNLTFIGTLYDYVNTRNYISEGKSLTLYVTWNNLGDHYAKIMLTDYGNVASMNGNCEYRWSFMEDQSMFQQVTLDATIGPASLSIVNYQTDEADMYQDWPILVDIQYSDSSATVKAFAGLPNANMSAYYITAYPALEAQSRLAQRFPGTMLTLVLVKGTATFNFTTLPYNYATNWGIARPRKGVFISHNYGFPTMAAATTVPFLNMTIEIGSDFDSANSWIEYQSTTADNKPYQPWKQNAPWPDTIEMQGQEFVFAMNSGDSASFGQIVPFEMGYLDGYEPSTGSTREVTTTTIGTTPTSTTTTTTSSAPSTSTSTAKVAPSGSQSSSTSAQSSQNTGFPQNNSSFAVPIFTSMVLFVLAWL